MKDMSGLFFSFLAISNQAAMNICVLSILFSSVLLKIFLFEISSLPHGLFISVLINFQVFVVFPVAVFDLFDSLMFREQMVREHTLCDLDF